MPSPVLPPSGPAALETVEEHVRIGRRWLARAMRDHPGLLPEDALAAAQLSAGILDASSVGRYRADFRYALLEEMISSGRSSEFNIAWEKVDTALSSRKAKIPSSERRTSALKVEDATDQEARNLFVELKRSGLKSRNPNAILAALFVLVAGHCGFRPIELREASFDGIWLTLPNAKKRPGHPPTRRLNLSSLHVDVRTGVSLLLNLIDHDLSKREFAKWQKCLAGQLRRGCERIGIRNLSLYSFRHVAVASWSAAGLSIDEIAKLCGHLSVRTAHAHYARADVGHKRRAVARADLSEIRAVVKAAVANPSDNAINDNGGARPQVMVEVTTIILEDMPLPNRKKDDAPPNLSPEEVRSRFDRLIDPRSVEEIAQSLRRAHSSGRYGPDRKSLEDFPAAAGEQEEGNASNELP